MEKVYCVDEIRGLLNPIFSSYPVRSATLFGSYARGEADKGSDLDIVVDCDYKAMGLDYFGMWEEIRETLNKRIDLFGKMEIQEGSPIAETIEVEGVMLYASP
jgi:predicted nucleotidyltransferase